MIRPFLDKLGGPRVVAEKVAAMSGAALTTKAVTQWAYDGTVPHKWRPFVFKLAKRAQISVPDTLNKVS